MLLFDVVYAHRATGTHHKIAMDALRRLTGPDAEAWQKLFLANADAYMKGAKAPDDVFHDSQNHVLHVRDNYWGGALQSAETWYEKLLLMIKAQNWVETVYAAGVLSHYVCDPMQPLHTAQCEAEGAMHRAFEQSVSKSYAKIMANIEAKGWPNIATPTGPDWLRALVRSGAESAVQYYDGCIDHYNLAAGVKNPPAGLDDYLIDAMTVQLGRAISSFARVLDHAFVEAAVAPPKTDITVQGYLSTLDVPVQWVTKKMADATERDTVNTMYAEFQATGKVVKNLPHDDRIVRAAHAREVLQRPLHELDSEPARKPGALHGYRDVTPAAAPTPVAAAPVKQPPPPQALAQPVQQATIQPPPLQPVAVQPVAVQPIPADREPSDSQSIAAATPATSTRKRRTRENPVIDAPAIGAKIAARLEAIGVKTIGDLLDADPQTITAMMAQRWLTANTVTDWKAMAQLAIDVQAVGEQDAQILVACGVRDKSALAQSDARALQDHLDDYLASDDGKRMMRGNSGPKAGKVEAWIAAAKTAA